MNLIIKSLFGAGALLLSAQAAAAQITFYDGEGFRGRAISSERAVPNFGSEFNDFASSVVVDRGHWEVCEDVRYGGNCVILGPGSYDSLRDIRMADRISSVRPVNSRRQQANRVPAPLSEPNYEYRRRAQERVYQANVTSVRAVLSQGDQRCWMERDRYDQQSGDRGKEVRGAVVGAIIGGILGHQIGDGSGRDAATVGGAVTGAVVGAIIGGILGHQIGDGSGRDAATVGGAVTGAVVGSRAGRDNRGYERGVQRCETRYDGAPQYWDVSYDYRGVEHWVRMSDPPGRTIAVNRNGEPRQ